MKLSQTVKDLERVTVRPYLRERGFTGTGPRFERTVGETPQRIEVQRAKFDYMKGFVYLNGIISVPVLDQLLGRTVGRNITLRPNHVDRNLDEAIIVTHTSDPDDLSAVAVRGLDALVSRMNELTTTADAVDYLSAKKLNDFEGVFGWYLQHDQLDRAQTFVTGLHEYFGAQPRWEKLAGKLDDVAAHVAPDTAWRTWLSKS
ncbi:hypothetical protein J3D45_002724 [Microbacterium foliorum]|uniref:hypothetical protein n=1 Tax=Microbacterium foliorum TaxID=104336 RepID=UPI0020A04DB9|nr:hypothetical protein [Microbacterium foliorum]MCP1430226.1 hypothetical protein [Microbacterium foliorum]